jgi:Leucine-rich repeat (LRR) protein
LKKDSKKLQTTNDYPEPTNTNRVGKYRRKKLTVSFDFFSLFIDGCIIMWNLFGFKPKYKKGEKVEALHPVSGRYVSAVVSDVHEDGQNFTLEFDGGESAMLSSKNVRNISTKVSSFLSTVISTPSQSRKETNISPQNKVPSPADVAARLEKGPSKKSLSRQESIASVPSEDRANSSPGRSRRGSNARRPSVAANMSRRGSALLKSGSSRLSSPGTPTAKPKSASKDEFERNDKPLTPVVKPPKIKKELGKEEIILLSRIRKCNEEEQKSIDISRLNLDHIPESMQQLSQLQELIARKNHFSSLIEISSYFFNLEKLDLSFNNNVVLEIANWSSFLPDLPYLKSLELGNCELAIIPEEIQYLKRLERLVLRKNNIILIPFWITELRYLHTLDISFNAIEELPNHLSKLKTLSELNLMNNPCLENPNYEENLTPQLSYLISKV